MNAWRVLLAATLGAGLIAAASAPAQNIVHWTQGPGPLGLGYPVPQPQDTPLPFDGFRSYDGLHARHQDLMLGSDAVFGEIVGHTRLGRDIWLYHFGGPDKPDNEGLPRPAIFIAGTLHAREWQSPEVVTGLLEYLADSENDGHWISYLRDNVNVMAVPVTNIDGFLQTQRYPAANYLGTDNEQPHRAPRDGRMRRKNHRNADEVLATAGDHLQGVDLNRNNPPFWPGPPRTGNPVDLTYRGPSPGSEPEIQSLRAAARRGPEDRLRFYADMHSYSRVFFSVRTSRVSRNRVQTRLLDMLSRHHQALPGGKLYTDVPEFAGSGIGTTAEYFGYQYQIPSLTWEIEPGQGTGTEYGGFGSNGHDGFILPESEIRRVRENLAQTLAASAYHMAGPPHLQTVHVIDEATGALILESDWAVTGATSRELRTRQVRALEPGRAYLFWLAFSKPMRWRQNGVTRPFPGQPATALEVDLALVVGSSPLALEQSPASWRDSAGPSPHGFQRYRDDAVAVRVVIADTAANRGLINDDGDPRLSVFARDMTGLQLDADPASVADWIDGGWSGYADTFADPDRTRTVPIVAGGQAAPFPVEPGHSALWYERARSGEGFVLENLDGARAVVYWFTYDEDGNPRWLTGVGDIHGNRVTFPELHLTSGGRFGPGFDPDDVVREVVASGEFLFADCNRGWFDYTGLGQTGRFDLHRLSRTNTVDCNANDEAPALPQAVQSGSWYEPARSGEGFTLMWMVNGDVVLKWFTYDPNGNPYWLVGVGRPEGDEIFFPELHTARGARFGAAFDPDDVERMGWGELRLRLGCEHGNAWYDSLLPEFGSGSLDLTRLTALAGLDCRR